MSFHRLFQLGVVLLVVLMGGSLLWSSMISPNRTDWLIDKRYVELSASRYQAGSVTHFDLQAAKPPRNVGFYFLVAPDGHPTAVFDRPGCLLEHRRADQSLYNPCTQHSHAIAAIMNDESDHPEIRKLPITEMDGQLTIDLQTVLPGFNSRQ